LSRAQIRNLQPPPSKWSAQFCILQLHYSSSPLFPSLTFYDLCLHKKTPLKIHCLYLGNKEIYYILKTYYITCSVFHKIPFIS
jgi:hypothetical protein